MVTTISKQAGQRYPIAGMGGASMNVGLTSMLGVNGTLSPAAVTSVNALFVMLLGGPTLYRAGQISTRVGE